MLGSVLMTTTSEDLDIPVTVWGSNEVGIVGRGRKMRVVGRGDEAFRLVDDVVSSACADVDGEAVEKGAKGKGRMPGGRLTVLSERLRGVRRRWEKRTTPVGGSGTGVDEGDANTARNKDINKTGSKQEKTYSEKIDRQHRRAPRTR